MATAIDMAIQEASEAAADIPIDDPARATILCLVTAVRVLRDSCKVELSKLQAELNGVYGDIEDLREQIGKA